MAPAHLPDEDGEPGEGSAFDWLRRSVHEPELLLAECILVFVVVISALQITLRYVFNAPLEWPEELSGVLVIWLTFLGAVTLVRHGQHARVELLDFTGDSWPRRILYALWGLCTVVFLLAVIAGSISYMQQMTFERLPTLRIKLAYVIAIVPIAAAAMIWFYLRRGWTELGNLRRGRRP